MVSTDPIADMLTRIRNAIAVNKTEISLPHSKAKETIAKILVEEGFLAGVTSTEELGRKNLVVTINEADRSAQITAISRLSSPGRRVYVKAAEIPVVKRGRGVVVLSTSEGVMTGSNARAKSLGGELICKVY
jgi:small subunit ribosomal protein S8